MTLTIAVLGARGRLGHVVTQAALAAGHSVLAVTRDGMLPETLAGATARKADAMNQDELVAATRDADVIFNALNPLYPDWKEMCPVLAENVVAAAKANGAHHLFAGNVYNYGREIPALAGPETPVHGSTRKGAIRIAMEKRFERAAREEGVDTTVLRAGDFFGGPGRGSWFDLIIAAPLARHKYVWPGRPDIAHSFAYLPDLARAFVALAERHRELKGFTVFTFAGHTLTGEEMGRYLDVATGKRLRRASFSWLGLRALGLFRPFMREVIELSYLWFTPHALDGSKFEAFVGGFEATPKRRAIAEAVRELKAEKEKAAA